MSALNSIQLIDAMNDQEETSIYEDDLVYELREDGGLNWFQRKIYVLNPKQVRKWKLI